MTPSKSHIDLDEDRDNLDDPKDYHDANTQHLDEDQPTHNDTRKYEPSWNDHQL